MQVNRCVQDTKYRKTRIANAIYSAVFIGPIVACKWLQISQKTAKYSNENKNSTICCDILLARTLSANAILTGASRESTLRKLWEYVK